jgi:hypothetical protein
MRFRLLVPLGILAMLALPGSALATHQDDPRSSNVVPLGESLRPGGFLVTPSDANSDLAFWRNYAIQGTYTGFRIVDISNPAAPTQVSITQCGRSQGDITVSEDGRILVRSQDEARVLPNDDINQACNVGTPGTATTGWEGLQIFDISDKANPRFVKAVYTDCGSHTHTQFQDNANNRLIIYVSRGGCEMTGPNPYGGEGWGTGTPNAGRITAVEVPLANPAGARVVNRAIPAGERGCHDVSVFEEIRDMFGACRPNNIHWDISDPVNPTILHQMGIEYSEPPNPTAPEGRTLTGWHTAQFSWNGEILISGWEPGGGSDPECEAADHPLKKSVFFWSADTGALLGMWTLPRGQTNTENCTIHNLTAVPFPDRNVLVQGSYQSGTSWVDFTNPGAPFEFAWSDPPPLVPTQLGGAWSTYWYNDVAWESDIPTGLRGYRLTEQWWPAAFNMTRFNPQTNETLFRCRARITTTPTRMRAGRRATVTVRVTQTAAPAAGQPVALQRVRLRGPGVSANVRTNMSGVARVRGVTASRRGTLRASLSRQINMAGCSATKRVLRAAVVGAPAGGRLTGSR